MFLFLCNTSNGTTESQAAFLDVESILEGWEAQYGSILSMQVKYTERKFDFKGPDGGRLLTQEHAEKKQDGRRYYMAISWSENGFADNQRMRVATFNGSASKEHVPSMKYGKIKSGLSGAMQETHNRLEAYMFMTRYYTDKNDPDGTPVFTHLIKQAMKHGSVKVRPALETVRGEPCHVIEATRPGQVRTFWLAHNKDFLPMKYEINEYGKVVNTTDVLKVAKTVTDNGVFWYPAEVEYVTHYHGRDKFKYVFKAQEFIPHAKFPPDTFDIQFPNGTRIDDFALGMVYVKGAVSDLPQQEGQIETNQLESSGESETLAQGQGTDIKPNNANDQNEVPINRNIQKEAVKVMGSSRKKGPLVTLLFLFGVSAALIIAFLIVRYRNRTDLGQENG